jgi:SH3-like domain-containing protein
LVQDIVQTTVRIKSEDSTGWIIQKQIYGLQISLDSQEETPFMADNLN